MVRRVAEYREEESSDDSLSTWEVVFLAAFLVSSFAVAWTVIDFHHLNTTTSNMVELSKSCDLEQVGKDAMSEFLSRLGKDRVAQENLEQLFGELAYKMVRNISGPVTQDVRFQMASSFLPQNWGKELNNIASTNFSKTMKLLADGTRNLTNALQAELYNQDGDDYYDCYNYGTNCLTKYQEKAAAMHVVTQVFDILSEVQWGSEPYIKPDGSSFGQFLAELQPFIERSLEDMEMRKKAAESCIILANRMAATDFSWCYTTYYGRECVDANPQTRTATAYVIEFCTIIRSTTIL